MGKTDKRDPEVVEAAHPGVSYRAFDLIDAGHDRFRELLTEVSGLLADGTLKPPPIRCWDVRRGAGAFEQMRRGHHVGKLVLQPPRALDPDRAVLVTGGLGLIGAAVARHLVTVHGARRLVLTGRRGPATEGAAELVAELEQLGADVRVEACDVGDREQVNALVGDLAGGPGITAVVHAAGVLDDAVLAGLTPEHVDRVFAPKADGAWWLHEATREHDLAAFVAFSSIGGTFGGPGQANYSAANAFLDALAAVRQAEGSRAPRSAGACGATRRA
jgi:NADP-dependent 3-hydroxy acid dehydrogenase YdfG